MATVPASPPAGGKKSSGLRIPVRIQISGLLAFFVALVAWVSFRSTFSYLEEDKVSTIGEVQALQVAQVSRTVQDNVRRARQQLVNAGSLLLNPALGTLSVDPATWLWVQVRDKSWKAEGVTLPELPQLPSVNADSKLVIQKSPLADTFFIAEPLKIKDNNVESSVFVMGLVKRKALLGDASQFERGPVSGVIVDIGAALSTSSPTDTQLRSAIWLGGTQSSSSFAAIFTQMDSEWQKNFVNATKPISREWQRLDSQTQAPVERFAFSWSRIPIEASDLDLVAVSFVEHSALLKGFKRMIVQQTFYAFLLIGFGIFASLLLARRISKPIDALVEAAAVLETGNFKVRVSDRRRDEFGDLARAFNHMGETLEQREEALKMAQGALVQNEKLAALGTLSAGIAHEVKNPLAGILGHADLALQQTKKFPEDQASALVRYLETIQKETKRCRGIIDSLMRFSRQEKSTLENVDLELVAWEAVHLMEHPLNMAKVRVKKAFAADVHMISGNANQVEQVLLNMLQNAGHAMPQGGEVTIGTEFFSDPKKCAPGKLTALANDNISSGAIVRIYIQDQGTGMTEEIQRKIFEPFFTTKPKGVGTGLGLSVTMGILGEHKCRLSLNSAPGKGTTFFMDFPAKQARTPEVMAQLDEVRGRKEGGAKLSTDIGAASPTPPLPKAPGNEIEMPKMAPPPGTAAAPAAMLSDPQKATRPAWQLAGDDGSKGAIQGATKAPKVSSAMQSASHKFGDEAAGGGPKFAIRKPKVNG